MSDAIAKAREERSLEGRMKNFGECHS